MRVAPRPFRARAFTWAGGACLALAILLASPGVRFSHAEPSARADALDFSWDPALEPAPAPAPIPVHARKAVTPPAGTCAAQGAPAVLPSTRAMRGLQGLPGMPLRIADGDRELNSLNGRGYNIGKTEPSEEVQALMAEIRRRPR